TCPPINHHTSTPAELTVSTVASLLYFDQVHTMTIFNPIPDGTPHSQMMDAAMKHLIQGLGSGSWVTLDFNNLPHATCCRDALWAYHLCYVKINGDLGGFWDNFDSLIKEQVLAVHSWHDSIRSSDG